MAARTGSGRAEQEHRDRGQQPDAQARPAGTPPRRPRRVGVRHARRPGAASAGATAARRSSVDQAITPAAGRAPGRPRRPTGSGRRRGSSAGGPSATIRPSAMTTTRGEEVRGQDEVVEDGDDRRAVPLVEVDQQLASPRPGGGCRGGRSARRGRGSAPSWARARAMNTSCRSPSDSSRTSRPRSWRDPDPLDGGVDGREVARRGARSAAARAAAGRARRPPRPPSRTAAGRARARPRWSARRPVGPASQDRLAAQRDDAGAAARGRRSGTAAASTCRRRWARRWRAARPTRWSGRGTSRMRRSPRTCSLGTTAADPVAAVTARTPSALAAAGTGRTARR